MKFRFFYFLISAFILFSCSGQTTKNIEATAFAEKINRTKNPQILDVRTPEEFALEHLDNAININWLGTDFVSNTKKLDKSKPIFVYCKSGGRSEKATAKLEELGFTTIYELQGGILKWNSAGLSNSDNEIIGITSQEYVKLLNSNKKILIDFYAEWCAPCKKMTPYLLKMQKELADKVVIVRLNADENKTLIKEMKIDLLPTLILYENNVIKWKYSGYISEIDLKKQL